MPPYTVPFWGSFVSVNRSLIISCLCCCAQTRPLYLVARGQSMDATTYKQYWQTIIKKKIHKQNSSHLYTVVKYTCLIINTDQLKKRRSIFYCSNWRWRILARWWMCYIGTKYDCWLVSQERVSIGAISHECAFKQCVGPTHLFLFFKKQKYESSNSST